MTAEQATGANEPDQRVVLAVHDLRKSFGTEQVLRGVNFRVREGEVTCVIGPSGSGKSTLLRCVNHLEAPSAGHVEIDGVPIGRHRRRGRWHEMKPRQIALQRRAVGMVFQQFNLFPHLTVLQNVIEAPTHVGGLDRATAVEQAMRALAEVGLTEKRDAYPRQLSGGQQQRVAIARALAMKPRLMMFDEPTSALDPELVGEVLEVIARLAATGTTMLVVTHELGFARKIADRVIFMDGGLVVEEGPAAQVLNDPREERTRSFLSRVL